MKTGRDIWEQALRLLRYTNGYGELDGGLEAALYKRGLAVVNQIYADLWYLEQPEAEDFFPLRTLEQEVRLSDRLKNDSMVYGVAMLLAQSEDDIENQEVFAAIYNQKRRAGAVIRRADTIPTIRI
ncbi:MAG: hypothetical protein HFJ80_03735 [Clostridiales bacterium]|nr:hypothetical protein [Clostridiales bacterium]